MIAGGSFHSIAIRAEREDCLELVPPVRQLAANVERKIDLSRSELGEFHQGAAVAVVSPASSLALTRFAILSSAVISAADQA